MGRQNKKRLTGAINRAGKAGVACPMISIRDFTVESLDSDAPVLLVVIAVLPI